MTKENNKTNFKEKIRYNATEIQICTEKARVLANFILEKDNTPSTSYTPAYFINMMVEEIAKCAEEIEVCTFDIKDN